MPRVAKNTRTVKSQAKKTESKTLVARVVDTNGKSVSRLSLPAELFAAKVNKKLLAQVARVYLANQRAGSAATKTRGEVRGSTRKLYRQKGTGRARHGAIRAPIFVGGGVVFGPQPRDYSLKLTKKMKRAALASALTSQYQEGKVTFVTGLEHLEPKTKIMAQALEVWGAPKSALLVVGPQSTLIAQATRNIPTVTTIPAQSLNPYAILSHQKLILTKEAVPILAKTFVNQKSI